MVIFILINLLILLGYLGVLEEIIINWFYIVWEKDEIKEFVVFVIDVFNIIDLSNFYKMWIFVFC